MTVRSRRPVSSGRAASSPLNGAATRNRGRAWWGAALGVAAVGWGAQQFAPLLLMYQSRLGLSATTIQAIFVFYVVGLVPGLLVGGPVSDRYGRRRVMVPTLLLSAGATVLLTLGGTGDAWLFAGRLVTGVASGAAFSCGAAWIRELSVVRAADEVNPGPRRVTVAVTVGFGLGPLVAGILAQWTPLPTVLPYVPHLALTAVALAAMVPTPETVSEYGQGGVWGRLHIPELRERRFTTVVVPLAPWVLIPVSVAVAYLPGVVKAGLGGYEVVFSAIVVTLAAAAGVLVQPLARRAYDPGRPRLLGLSMAIVVAGILIAASAAATGSPAIALAAVLVLGAGYGSTQVCGLLEVQRLALPGHLASLTAAFQAISYLGYTASLPLAAAGRLATPTGLLLGVALLAAATLAYTTLQAGALREVPVR
jgi:hypothetical protein